MPDAGASDANGPSPVSFVVENEDNKKFKVWTADVSALASQMRGKARFSVFNSIVLPFGVTILTALATTGVGQLFQYVSWRNSTELQKAQDELTRAQAAYRKVSTAMGERRYATLLFIDAVEDFTKRKKDVDSHVFRLDLKLNRERFDQYYKKLKDWNESNDQIIDEIDFALDRPAGILERHRLNAFAGIKCSNWLTEEMKRANLNPESLKLQFAVINHCFREGLRPFSEMKDRAVEDAAFVFDEKIKKDATARLSDLASMANVFRCHALVRIEFVETGRGRAIFVPIPDWLARWIGRPTKEERKSSERKKHLEDAKRYCAFPDGARVVETQRNN